MGALPVILLPVVVLGRRMSESRQQLPSMLGSTYNVLSSSRLFHLVSTVTAGGLFGGVKSIYMNQQKKILILLILLFFICWAYHLLFGKTLAPIQDIPIEITWSSVLVTLNGGVLILYTLSIKCPNPACRRRQVVRGWFNSAFIGHKSNATGVMPS